MSNYLKPALIGVALVSCVLALVSCVLAGADVRNLPAQAAPPPGILEHAALPGAVPGRYQLQNIKETPYLLDTETGRVWVNQKIVTATSKYNTITGSGGTLKIPIPESSWVEDSPTWAKPR